MENNIEVLPIGIFEYNDQFKCYELESGHIHWSILIDGEADNISKKINMVEKLFANLQSFNQRAKEKIAEELIDLKNEQWFEYDENDAELDWDAIEAGEYDITVEDFTNAITLIYVSINNDGIYCEYEDGELFGGHRIHAYFDKKCDFLKADI